MNANGKPVSPAVPQDPPAIECSSPPCQAHEVDPDYMGLAPRAAEVEPEPVSTDTPSPPTAAA